MNKEVKEVEATFECGVCQADVIVDIVSPKYLLGLKSEIIALNKQIELLDLLKDATTKMYDDLRSKGPEDAMEFLGHGKSAMSDYIFLIEQKYNSKSS